MDDHETLYVWNGAESNRIEQAKALDIATRIKNKDHQGRASLVMVNDAPPMSSAKFWDLLAADIEPALLMSPKSSPSSGKGASKPLPKHHHLITPHTHVGTDEGNPAFFTLPMCVI